MKTKVIILLSFVLFSFFVSCKKDEPKVSEEELDVATECAVNINIGIQSFVTSSISVAADEGFNASVPELPSMKKGDSAKGTYDYSWIGPDSQGWYTRSMNGSYGYDYYERIRIRDTIDYISRISYSGADGSYENTTTTKYIKYVKNQKTLYKGFSKWEVHTSGYSNMSRFEWKMTFTDWNPASCAGIYDWYWGVSENSGGDTVPLHRFENFTATEIGNNLLHCHITFYDEGNMEIWDFEYDTPYVNVDMPEVESVK
ncbi:MAG TPA: hypothetical protein PLR88_01075 [Bacteroidales bacterium]|nr:hypothetical protein [Bacteroidales bacterium]HPT20510.1 hypothetical protein [Bacteroidales bacterium]